MTPPPGVPLQPSGRQARSWLTHELLDPAYHRSNPIQDLIDWLARLWSNALGTAATASSASVVAALAVLLAVVLAVALLLSRARRDGRRRRARRAAAGQAETLSASRLRASAELALQEGRYDDAAVDAFRAIAARQHERGRVDLTPGATAHEVAGLLGEAFPDRRGPIDEGAQLFDEVHYGEHAAAPDQAAGLLRLDDELARPR